MRDNEAAICEALKRDIGRSAFEAFAGEIEWCKNDIIFMCDHLEKWTKDEKPADVPLLNSILGARIRKEPLGCVLIIGWVLEDDFPCLNKQLIRAVELEHTMFLFNLLLYLLLVL